MSPNLDNSGTAFAVTCLAGAATGLGAAAVFEQRLVKLASKPVLAAALGFSAGVMLYVSFTEMFSESVEMFHEDGKTEAEAYVCATVCLFSGMIMIRLLSLLTHMLDSHHSHDLPSGDAVVVEANAEKAADGETPQDKEAQVLTPRREAHELKQIGLKTALAIAIHNLPEGIASYVGTLADPSVGITLGIAIGIHNIPEGLCVALPIYYATGSRVKGFLYAMVSGLAEPLGAVIAWAIVKGTGEDLNDSVYATLFGLVAGVMIMLVLFELLPTAMRHDPTDKVVTNGMVVGMAVMAASLCLFKAEGGHEH